MARETRDHSREKLQKGETIKNKDSFKPEEQGTIKETRKKNK